MKTFLKVILGLVIILGLLIFLNFSKIQRLQTVNTLFNADKIVYNFSNMKEAFFFHQLKGSAVPQPWDVEHKNLPETVTIAGNKRNLSALLETLDTTAFIVIQDGKILSETYFKGTKQNDRRISWSVAKSFMSGLYGQAVESGQIKSLEDTVETYAPLLKGSAYEGVTVRNVLNMASGVTFDEDYMDPKADINKMGRVLGLGGSMDKFAAGLTARYAPAGERWQYVSIDTHVAAMVLRGATGKSLHELFNETYSANLGFEGEPYYLTDGKDVAFALGGLNLTTRDYAKFGQLFLQKGAWPQSDGSIKQVIPAQWVAESTEHTAPNLSDRGAGYGYQWWVPMPQEGPHAGDFFAIGIYGQYIYVNPAKNLVIAKNAADREFASAMEGYGHSMSVNIDLFRSLADYYGSPELAD